MKKIESTLRPMIGGLVILVALIGLIGTAIKNPQPHDIPVGLVGPAPATQQIQQAFATAAPGAFQFTTYTSEQDARAPKELGLLHRHRECRLWTPDRSTLL